MANAEARAAGTTTLRDIVADDILTEVLNRASAIEIRCGSSSGIHRCAGRRIDRALATTCRDISWVMRLTKIHDTARCDKTVDLRP